MDVTKKYTYRGVSVWMWESSEALTVTERVTERLSAKCRLNKQWLALSHSTRGVRSCERAVKQCSSSETATTHWALVSQVPSAQALSGWLSRTAQHTIAVVSEAVRERWSSAVAVSETATTHSSERLSAKCRLHKRSVGSIAQHTRGVRSCERAVKLQWSTAVSACQPSAVCTSDMLALSHSTIGVRSCEWEIESSEAAVKQCCNYEIATTHWTLVN